MCMKTYVCDRIEGDLAVLIDEEGMQRNAPVRDFAHFPREGDVFDEALRFDPEKTEERREKMRALFAKRKKKG